MPPAPKKAVAAARPGRTLIALFVAMAIGLGVMLLTGATSPRLGLDLAGGTSVTLIPRLPSGQSPAPDQLAQAIDVIRRRVNGLGVTESDVQTQGKNIVVSVPGRTGRDAVALISSTAQLRFRTVTKSEPVLQPVQPGASPVVVPPSGENVRPSGSAAPTGPAGTPGARAPGSSGPGASGPAASAPASSPAASAPAASAPASPTVRRRIVPQALVAPQALAGRPAQAAPSAPVEGPGLPAPKATTAPTPAPTTAPAPAPSSAPAPAPTAKVSPLPPVPTLLTAPPTGIEAQFAALNCADPKNRVGGGNKPADQPIVACDQQGREKYILGPTVIEGQRISNASAGQSQNGGQIQVNLSFDGQGTTQFADISKKLFQQPQNTDGNRFAIVLDNLVISAPSINSPILGGQAQITGNFTRKTAQDLASVLKAGALPITFDPGEVLTVSATVGADQLRAGILAGAIGLGLVILYSLAFYRALGIVSVLSLVVAGALTWGVISLLGSAISFALILAGVIGVIVSIGITADSFVVYFERLRDEIREGRTPRTAAAAAWPRARRTILVADSVTFLAALVLYFLSIGRVQNFAFTLGLTTIVDLVVVFFFTKPLVALLVRRAFFRDGHKLSGLNPESVGVRSRRPARLTRLPSSNAPASNVPAGVAGSVAVEGTA